MPLLEKLYLEDVLPVDSPVGAADATGTSTHELCSISLPRLRSLNLSGSGSKLARLLKYLQISPQVRTSISSQPPSKLSEISDICSALSPFFMGTKCPPLELDLCFPVDAVLIHIRAIGQPTSEEETSLSFTVESESHPVEDVIRVFIRYLPLHNVMALTFDGEPFPDDLELLRELLQAIPNLTTLTTGDETYSQLPSVLVLPADTLLPIDPPLILPKLDHIILERADFAYKLNHTSFLTRLQEAQFQRCEAAHPISELSVVHCYNITAERVKVLRQLFVDVHWDGFQSCFPNYDEETEDEDEDDEAANV